MEVIVDLQGFWKPTNVFVLKEVAILRADTLTPIVYQFAPPFPWRDLPTSYQKKNRWLERQYHGLRWNVGTLPYDTVKNVLTPLLRDASRIYVKGFEKTIWLQQLTDLNVPIEDLGAFNCPSLQDLQRDSACTHHPASCAAKNVTLLAKWMRA